MISTAYLIHGFVGAGKTTFARKLERQHRAVRFTHDEWVHKLYGPNPQRDRFDELYARIDELIWQLADRTLELGVDVILDSGFWSRESRDRVRSHLRQLGAHVVLYNVTCPEGLMRQRVLKRTQEVPADSLWINEAAFDLFKGRFEPLGNDEDSVLVDGSIELVNGPDA